VLVGAHLDSWDFATGAQDNGTGVAMVLEVARVIAELETPPRRSIRFALWGGEEQGVFGSRAYVDAHNQELDVGVLVLNTDHGSGSPRGWITQGREDLKTAMKAFGPLLSGLGGDGTDTKMNCDSDHCPFALAGVPVLELDVDDSKYDEIHHLPSDTLDKVTGSSLARGAAVVAVTAWLAADTPARLVPRLSHEEIAQHLKKADLEESVTRAGLWKQP
jgi:Zn-dependent M28 family amino/carboxypeptidase